MASPANNSYTVASGVSIYAGRNAPGLIGDVVVLGDSLTDPGYPHGAYRLGMGLTMRPPRMVFNGGVYGNTIAQAADRLQQILTDNPTTKGVMVRIGTNGPGTNTYQFQYGRIFDICEANGVMAIMHAVPPRGAQGPTTPNSFVAQNTWLKAQCEAKPAIRKYVEDSLRLGDQYYYCLPGYFSDNIHMTGLGVTTQAEDMGPVLQGIFANIDPRITSANDRYSIDPVNGQYVMNPLMAGTTTPTNWSGAPYGGSTTGTQTIVAADLDDPNQTPWMRVTYLTGGGTSFAWMTTANLEHPSIAADTSIFKRFDAVVEVRMNNLLTDNVEYLSLTVMHGGGTTISSERTYFKSSGARNDHFIFRCATPRATPLLASTANSMKLRIALSYIGSFTTSIGSIDYRCASVRGSST